MLPGDPVFPPVLDPSVGQGGCSPARSRVKAEWLEKEHECDQKSAEVWQRIPPTPVDSRQNSAALTVTCQNVAYAHIGKFVPDRLFCHRPSSASPLDRLLETRAEVLQTFGLHQQLLLDVGELV